MLFNLNLSKYPFLGQVIELDLLLCTGFDLEHVVLFLCHIFTQRPMHDRKIVQSYECCFGWQQPLPDLIKNFISHEKLEVTRSGSTSSKHKNHFDCRAESSN